MSDPVVKPPTHAGRRRRPRLVALGLLCVTLGGLGGAALYNATHEMRPVVAMARDVPRGEAITADDLTIVEAPPTVTEFTPAQELETLVGQTARFDLPAGAFPAPRLIGTPAIPDSFAVVGLVLGPGRIPVQDLVPGQNVRLVDLTEGGGQTDAVVVSAPQLLEDRSTRVLDVALAQDSAARIAALSAQDQVALYSTGRN
ncbi:MAG: SAF domain-containing protein [Propionibacteriaceae bacterium]|nr:SAF domain-containing protein [Propionibacteriaceae bacterium]